MNKPKHPPIPLSPPDKKSSQVHSFGYDAATKTLAVKFDKGGTYHYHGVSPEKFADMQKAESAGKYLGAHIKPHHKFTPIP